MLRAEEDGFALEHLDGEEEGSGGVDAGRCKDDGDEIPMVSANHKFLAEQTYIEDGDERQFGSELHTRQHRRDRRDDDDEDERHDIALRFFVALGECEMVIRTDEKRTASGTAMMKTERAAPKPMWSVASASPAWMGLVFRLLAIAKEMPIEMTESAAVVSAVVRTNRNLPRTRCEREIGLERIVSMVPRSFSPAVRSMAGCMPP